MANAPHDNVVSETADQPSKLYWLDIDVTFNDIIRRQRMNPDDLVARRPRSSSQYSVLRGVGTVANALSVGEQDATFEHFHVDLAAFAQSEENFAHPELHRSAKMIWNDVDARPPRLEVYVSAKMLRHMLELFVTKRIDAVILSMKIAVMQEPIVETNSRHKLLPLLDRDGHLYFRRTECELLSVHASLAPERTRRQS
jgi:hypothetical protein